MKRKYNIFKTAAPTQIDDTQMEALLARLRETAPLLFLLNLAHKLLGLLVLRGHDMTHTQIGQHDGSHVDQRITVLLHNRLVVSNSFFEFCFLRITG